MTASSSLVDFLLQLASLGRTDDFAQFAELYGKKVYARTQRPLRQGDVERHLTSAQPIGVYVLSGTHTRIAALDLDDHSGALPWAEMARVATGIVQVLAVYGLRCLAFRSGGGKGIHLFIPFERPQSAAAIRRFLELVLGELGVDVGDGGITCREVEVFPKQDVVEPGSMGSLIALPLARNSVPLGAEMNPVLIDQFIPPDFSAVLNEDLPTEQQWPVDERQVTPTAVLEGDEEEVASALKHIDARDYSTWIKIGLILRREFGEAGFPLWLKWSQCAGDKFKGEEDCREKWDGFKPRDRVGIGTLFHLAQKGSWNGPSDPHIRKMNARYVILTQGNKTQIIEREPEGGADDELPMISKEVLRDRHRSETLPSGDEGKRKPVADIWLAHPRAAQCHRLDFDPNKPPGQTGRTWNTWRGLRVQPRPGDWSLLKAHVLKNICRGDQQKFDWVMNWMALGLQDPGRVIGTVPVMVGLPGTGKGVLANAYGYLWGAHFTTITHNEHVAGRFNAQLANKRFVFIDEGMFGGNRKDAGTIKTRVTEQWIILERKGVDPIKLRNRMIFMVASNEGFVVPADLGDRRWMILEVGDEHREDHEYFAAVVHQLEKEGYEAMLHELQHRDISQGPNPRRVLKSLGLSEQILQAQPPHIRYMHQILEEGRLPQNDIAGARSTTIRALWEDMQASFPDARYMSRNALGRFIRGLVPGLEEKQSGKFRARRELGRDIYERSTQLTFPELPKCRRAFEHLVGSPIGWNPNVTKWQADEPPNEWPQDKPLPF